MGLTIEKIKNFLVKGIQWKYSRSCEVLTFEVKRSSCKQCCWWGRPNKDFLRYDEDFVCVSLKLVSEQIFSFWFILSEFWVGLSESFCSQLQMLIVKDTLLSLWLTILTARMNSDFHRLVTLFIMTSSAYLSYHFKLARVWIPCFWLVKNNPMGEISSSNIFLEHSNCISLFSLYGVKA